MSNRVVFPEWSGASRSWPIVKSRCDFFVVRLADTDGGGEVLPVYCDRFVARCMVGKSRISPVLILAMRE